MNSLRRRCVLSVIRYDFLEHVLEGVDIEDEELYLFMENSMAIAIKDFKSYAVRLGSIGKDR